MALSRQSAQSFDSLWAAFGSEHGLLPELALDAVIARYKQEEVACIPRIIELVCTSSVSIAESAEALQLVNLEVLSSEQRRLVEAALDRWWVLALSVPSDEAVDTDNEKVGSVTDILGVLAGFDAPMRRWLHVWLENFDGLGATLFVDAVLQHQDGTTTSEAWRGKQDEWSQFQAWCRAEPTVMGFTLIGGAHVDQNDVTAVLEKII